MFKNNIVGDNYGIYNNDDFDIDENVDENIDGIEGGVEEKNFSSDFNEE